MAIDIRINDNLEQNASDYSVVEDSTPIDPSDSSGGVGQITFTIPQKADAKSTRNKIVDLEDGSQGTTQGIARGINGNGFDMTVTADSRLAALAAERKAAPYVGTLDGAFRYYLGLVGVTERIVVDSAIADLPVTFQGWEGDAWFQMKKIAAALQVEISLVSDNIILRPLRGRIAENYRDASRSWDVDSTNIAQSVEIMYYGNEYRVGALAYPLGGWSDDVPVHQVEEGEILELDLPLAPNGGDLGAGSSLTSVQQPIAVDSVDRYYNSSSVYCAVRADGYPVTAAEWLAGGGRVTVEIGEDTKSLKVTVVGPVGVDGAPFRLAMPSGPSDYYSSLRIVGTGVFFNKQMLTLYTGRNPDRAPQEVAATVENECINTYDEAFKVGLWALAKAAGPKQTISVTTTGINRKGVSGSVRYPTIAEFNAEHAGLTIAEFNTIWAGATIAEFNAAQFEKVRNDFDNQAFGNVAGARVLDDDQWYRIRSATITPGSVQYNAEADTTIADFNEVWAGASIADFNAEWAGKTFADFATSPLRRTA